MARGIAHGHQINMAEYVAKLSRRENTIISFTDDKAWSLIHPHTDPLVVNFECGKQKSLLHPD